MSFIKNFISGEYAVCYRHLPENGSLLFQNEKAVFQVIANNKRYWYADPMLFEHSGRHYLFFEAYDKREKLGRIACCALQEDGTYSEVQIVVSEDFHLSYPNVFTRNGKIYMIPESAAANQILLYECLEFPDKWQKAAVLLDGKKTVDSTFFEFDGKFWLFSAETDPSVMHGTFLNLYEVKEDFALVPHPANPVAKDVSVSRPAGNIFSFGGDVIRPSQDCSEGDYGKALMFNKVVFDGKSYAEEIVFTVYPQNIHSNFNKLLSGCHTYTLSEDRRIEAVDVKYSTIDIILGIKTTLFNILKKLKLIH